MDIGFHDYEHVRALIDGTVGIDGVDATFHTERILSDIWWPYGVAANRPSVEAFLRWHYEQGLSRRRLTYDDIFVPELVNT